LKSEKIENTISFNEQEIVNTIKEIIADVADIDYSEIGMSSSLKNDLGIDSFTSLEILAAIENDIDISIERSKILRIEYFRDIVQIVQDYLK
jgi:acyl carrier protein